MGGHPVLLQLLQHLGKGPPQGVDPGIEGRLAQGGGEDGNGALLSIAVQPLLHQPLGTGVFRRQLLGEGLAGEGGEAPVPPQKAAEQAVDKAGGVFLTHAAGQLHPFVDCGGGGNVLHIQQLVEADPEDLPHQRAHLGGRDPGEPVNIPIQGDLPLQDAVEEGGGKALLPG